MLAQGLVDKEVADDLGISLDTVHTYVRRIYEKLQVRTVAQAAPQANHDIHEHRESADTLFSSMRATMTFSY